MCRLKNWSAMRDLNSRPSAPKADVLPDCTNRCSLKMAVRAGFEPATLSLTGICTTTVLANNHESMKSFASFIASFAWL